MIFKGYKNAQWDFNNFFGDPKTTEREILTTDLYQLIRKASDFHRNNAICASISRVMVEYVGATGNFIDVPSSQEQQDFILNWGKNCTVRGDSWDRFRRQRITDLVESGGSLILFTQDPETPKNQIGLKLEVIQGGRVCTPPDRIDGELKGGIISYSGIAYNNNGAEVGYWYKEGDDYPYTPKYNSLGLLNAYFERSPDAEKPTSGRTVPLITPVMTQIELVSKLERNMANWAEKVSVLGMILETPDPQATMAGAGMTNEDGTYKTEQYMEETVIQGDVLHNQITMAPPGTKPHIITPSGSADFNPIFEKFQKTISSGVGLISTILFGDTNGKNFAVSKFEAQTFIRKIENWARSINYLDEIICRQVLAEANLRGIGDFDVKAKITFGGAADFEGVDANKSADAASKRISNGTTTKTYEASKQGKDFESNMDTAVKEMNYVRELAKKNGWTKGEMFAWIGSPDVGVSVVSGKDEEIEETEEKGVEDEDD